VRFYEERASRARGDVLEYGCGNGRITLALARRGKRVLGVDLSEPMLADFEARLKLEPSEIRERIEVRHGDMRRLKLRRRFDLVICPFNAFLHLYTRDDVERFLARVREHLTPSGRFVFDVSVPDPHELSRPEGKLYKTRPFVYPGVGKVRYGEVFDYDALRQVLFVSMQFEGAETGEKFMTPLAHRQFYPLELEALLHYNGFSIERTTGDWEGAPTNDSRTVAYECRRRKGSPTAAPP
jgi:SAM-dependent methyltransferase